VLGDVFDMLLDAARDAQTLDTASRAEEASRHRADAHAELLGAGSEIPGLPPRPSDQHHATYHAWAADLLEDPSLVEHLTAFLSPEEATTFSAQCEGARSPYPLHVHRPTEPWRCSSCGTEHAADQAEAVEIGVRPGWSALNDPIRYCAPCILTAAAAIDPTALDFDPPDGLSS